MIQRILSNLLFAKIGNDCGTIGLQGLDYIVLHYIVLWSALTTIYFQNVSLYFEQKRLKQKIGLIKFLRE